MSEETNEADATEIEPVPDPEVVDIRTGVASIDAALDSLTALDGLEITEHPPAYDSIHGVLREALAHAGRPEGPPVDP